MVLSLDFQPIIKLATQGEFEADWQRQYEDKFTKQRVFNDAMYFPHLRFIMVSGLKNADNCPPSWRLGGRSDGSARWPGQMLLLDVAGSPKISSQTSRQISTSEVATTWAYTQLMFLDLSFVSRDTSFARLYSAFLFSNLRILKLKGLNLTDDMLPGAVLRTEGGLWSLDLSDNKLTDQAAYMIAQGCFLPKLPLPTVAHDAPWNSGEEMVEEVPRYDPLDHEVRIDNFVSLRPDSKEEFVTYMRRNALLTQNLKPILNDKDDMIYETGLTQLYISKNKLTSVGVRHLLEQTNRLQVLDVGSVTSHGVGHPSGQDPLKYTKNFAQPHSVYPLIRRFTGTRMEVLRIHHSIATYCPTIMSSSEQTTGYTLPNLYYAENTLGPAGKVVGSGEPAFVPSYNPRLKHLTLTGLPTKSYGFIIAELKMFLIDAAEQEQKLATAPTHRRAPQQFSGLKTLTLEMVKEQPAAHTGAGASVTGDRDADRLAEEAETDFTFFGKDGPGDFSFFEEDGPEANKARPLSEVECDHLGGSRSKCGEDAKQPPADAVVYDVVEELEKFREEMAVKWSGEICVKYPEDVQ